MRRESPTHPHPRPSTGGQEESKEAETIGGGGLEVVEGAM